jgi:hypothetical protein
LGVLSCDAHTVTFGPVKRQKFDTKTKNLSNHLTLREFLNIDAVTSKVRMDRATCLQCRTSKGFLNQSDKDESENAEDNDEVEQADVMVEGKNERDRIEDNSE